MSEPSSPVVAVVAQPHVLQLFKRGKATFYVKDPFRRLHGSGKATFWEPPCPQKS